MKIESATSFEDRLRNRLKHTLASTGHFFVPDNLAIAPRRRFKDLLEDPCVSKEIDPAALCEFPSHYAFFGSRTILRHARRTDWYAMDHQELSNGAVATPPHDQRTMPAEQLAEGFVRRLLDETRERIRDCTHLGLLLSGGMDSRIVAAALAELQRSGWEFQVTCFTWGQPNARDTVYARRIANHYGWRFIHFALDAETLWRNVVEVARSGCFHSAMHLHAMPNVAERAEQLDIDLMLAGSYGDSIGRAEYSGLHVSHLPPIDRSLRNWYGLLDEQLFRKCRIETVKELDRCRKLYGNRSERTARELDRQLHYMRNMLGSAMDVIDARVPLAQAYTSRSIVEFMWSLAPESRVDDIYYFVLRTLDPVLLEIPWARTGRPFLQSPTPADDFQRNFHDYGEWARAQVERLEQSVFSGEVERTGAFRMAAIDKLFRAFKKYSFVQSGRILECVLWLSSLGLLLERLQPPPVQDGPTSNTIGVRHRLELYGSLTRQYKAFGRSVRSRHL